VKKDKRPKSRSRVASKVRPAAKKHLARPVKKGAAAARIPAQSQRLVVKAAAQPPPQKLKLKKEQRQKYAALLNGLRDKIQKQISFLANDSLSKPDADEPRDDVTDDFDRDFALSLLTSEHHIMFEIDEALKRIAESTYGRCEQCGSTITVARLSAVPFARMCVGCQSDTEKDRPRYQPFGSVMTDAVRTGGSQSAASPDE